MPAADLIGTIRSAIQKNREIPAMLDAYGEFIDGQIGPLELQDIDSVFARVLDNLRQRFPEIASSRAANTAKNDILSFMMLASNDVDRVKQALKSELETVSRSMGESIAERFTRMNSEERRAIDATLRLIRRSSTDILFRTESGKQLSNAGREFERFFTSVKTEAPSIKELRYENLIVEKAVFNKLLMKTKNQDYTIWVPSLFAKENVDYLIERVAVPSEHLLLSHLVELKLQGSIGELRNFLSSLLENSGILSKPVDVPESLKDYVEEKGNYYAMSPLELDDIASFLAKEEEERISAQRAEEERARKEVEERQRVEEERKAEQLRMRRKQVTAEGTAQPSQPKIVEKSADSIYIGKQLDTDQFMGAISRRLSEQDLYSQVKTLGDYYVDGQAVRSKGVAIVGSSGSGRSTTLKRFLDGLGGSGSRVLVIDQKGEHRGVAWKYQWKTLGFASDTQAQEFRLQMPPGEAELLADLLQEWCLQSGLSCSEQQRARILSTIKAQSELSIENVVSEISKEVDLSQIGSKLSKNLVGKGNLQRIFSKDGKIVLQQDSSLLVDISGRGLRDPTTKEERVMIAVLALREFLRGGVTSSIIVLEDILDRLKSESLKRNVAETISLLKAKGNSFIVTSRGTVREYIGNDCIEILHRLSGEKAVNDELSEFATDIQVRSLSNAVGFLPRGYAFTSKFTHEGATHSTAIVRVEPLQFGTT